MCMGGRCIRLDCIGLECIGLGCMNQTGYTHHQASIHEQRIKVDFWISHAKKNSSNIGKPMGQKWHKANSWMNPTGRCEMRWVFDLKKPVQHMQPALLVQQVNS